MEFNAEEFGPARLLFVEQFPKNLRESFVAVGRLQMECGLVPAKSTSANEIKVFVHWITADQVVNGVKFAEWMNFSASSWNIWTQSRWFLSTCIPVQAISLEQTAKSEEVNTKLDFIKS